MARRADKALAMLKLGLIALQLHVAGGKRNCREHVRVSAEQS